MENTLFLRRTLWANALLVELLAFAALFLNTQWKVIQEFTGGYSTAIGIDLLLFAGFVMYTARKKTMAPLAWWVIVAFNALLAIIMFEWLLVPSIPTIAKEILLLDLGALGVLLYRLIKGQRLAQLSRQPVLPL